MEDQKELAAGHLIHPIHDAVVSIDQGEDPWFELGCFLHDWWRYAIDRRQDLINTPPAPTTTAEGKRWAAFLPQPYGITGIAAKMTVHSMKLGMPGNYQAS
jgi:hypothetical protein